MSEENRLVGLDEMIHFQTSSSEVRSALFLPVKPTASSVVAKEFFEGRKLKRLAFENKAYVVEIRNRLLTQRHKDIVDIVLSTARRSAMGGEFTYVSTISLREIARRLGLKSSNTNYVKAKVEEIADVSIYLHIKDKFYELFSEAVKKEFGEDAEIFSDFHFHILKYGFNRAKQEISFVVDELYLLLVHKTQVTLNYSKLLPDIISIDDLTVKSIVRYCLAQKRVYMKTDTILRAIRYPVDSVGERQIRKIRAKLKSGEDKLARFGISYNPKNDVITYDSKNNNGVVKILTPAKEKMLAFVIASKIMSQRKTSDPD